MNPVLLTAAKYVLAFPVCYHYINGIRHLVSGKEQGLRKEALELIL